MEGKKVEIQRERDGFRIILFSVRKRKEAEIFMNDLTAQLILSGYMPKQANLSFEKGNYFFKLILRRDMLSAELEAMAKKILHQGGKQ